MPKSILPPAAANHSGSISVPTWEAAQNRVADSEEWSGLLACAGTLYRRKGILALILLAGIIGAVVVSMSQDRMYESRASIEIQGVNENFLNFQNIDPATPNGSPESFIQTQAEILRQDVLIEQVARKLRIAEQPETSKSPHAVAGSKFPEDLPQNLIETVKKHLKIKSSRDSRIIQIVFVARDPQFTADFANTLAQEFIEQSVEARRRAAQQIQDWLSPQLEALRTKLGKSETALDAYARATGLMFTEGQQNLAQEKLKLLQDELSKAQGDRIAKESWYQLAATNKPESLMDDPAIRDYDAKIADLRRQQADLQSILTPQNYKVIRLKAQIDQLESTRDREVKRIQQRLQNDYKAAEAREQNLAQVYSRQSGLVSSLSDKITHYHTLKHEVDSNRQFYESMVQKVNEAGIASAVRQSNIRLVGPAKPAPEPYKPNVPFNLAIGVFASLTVGAGFVLLQEQADSRLHVPGEAGVYLTLPELGAIQKFQPRTVLPQRLLRSGNGDHGLERITWEQTRSGWSESFRATVASLLSAGCNGDCPRILLVTSSLPREGKTTVASNLAIALAEISKRVLLVDADVRRPRLHKIFGVANDRGFIDLLVRENAFDESPVAPLIKKTAVPHLYVLPSGAYKNNIFSLLQSEGTDRLLRRFRQAFDYVIVDSPPCLHLADARLLARYADGAVLVVRADHAEKKTALAAAQRLMLDGVTVLGTILNGWDPAGRGGTYGYEYSKYETLTDQHPHSSR